MTEVAHNVVRTRHEPAPLNPFLPAARESVAPKAASRQAAAIAFVDELYASVLEPQRLASALTCFARLFDAAEAWLVSRDESDDVCLVERSLADSARRSVGLRLARRVAEAIVDWPDGCRDGVRLGSLADDVAENYLAVTCDVPGQPTLAVVAFRALPFAESEREVALALAADIRRALQLRGRAKLAESVGDGLRMFEDTSIAVLVTRQRSVERSNAAATALIAAGRPIGLAGGKLRFEDARAQGAFETISRTDAQGHGRHSFAFVVEGLASRTWIAQISLARREREIGSQKSAVVVALTPFSGASQTREAMLDGFTELTPTERAIFASVVDGEDVAAIAAKMNRSVETVRWHVRNLFTKLGVNSQADLARLGALLLPI